MMKFWKVLTGVLILGALASCGGETTSFSSGTLRAIHGVVGGPTVDVTFGLDFVAEGLVPGSVGPYRQVNAGTLPLNIVTTGTSGDGFNTIATVPADVTSSMYILDGPGGEGATIVVLPDNVANVGEARRVRVLHAIGGAGSVQFRVGPVNAPVADTNLVTVLPFAAASAYINVLNPNQEIVAVNPETLEVVARSGSLDPIFGRASTLMLVISGSPQFIRFNDGPSVN